MIYGFLRSRRVMAKSTTQTRSSCKCSHCGRTPTQLRGNELFLIGQTCPGCKQGTFVECKVEDTRKGATRNQGSLWGFGK